MKTENKNLSQSVSSLPADLQKYGFWNELKALSFVKAIYLFGSRARGDCRAKSDIDIAIDCTGATECQWQILLYIIENADTLLGIDVVRYDTLDNSSFKQKINKDRVVVYEK